MAHGAEGRLEVKPDELHEISQDGSCLTCGGRHPYAPFNTQSYTPPFNTDSIVSALDRQTAAIREAGELMAGAILQSKFSGATPRGTVLRVRDLRAALRKEE
jgi:hypothetical protein